MSLRARLVGVGTQMIGKRGVIGHFDGLSGLAFDGWVAGPSASAVRLMLGDYVICQTFAIIERSDLASAGIQGFGFSIPAALVDEELRGRSHVPTHPASLHVIDASGAMLGGAVELVSQDDLLRLLAICTAIRVLGAPSQGATHGVY